MLENLCRFKLNLLLSYNGLRIGYFVWTELSHFRNPFSLHVLSSNLSAEVGAIQASIEIQLDVKILIVSSLLDVRRLKSIIYLQVFCVLKANELIFLLQDRVIYI